MGTVGSVSILGNTQEMFTAGASGSGGGSSGSSWFPGGGARVVSDVNITLTSESNKMQEFCMIEDGLSLTLPDATTMETGFLYFFANKKGDIVDTNTFNVIDADGTELLPFDPATAYLVSLLDNTTTAGVWNFSGFKPILYSSDIATGCDYDLFEDDEAFWSIAMVELTSTKYMIITDWQAPTTRMHAQIIELTPTLDSFTTYPVLDIPGANWFSAVAKSSSVVVLCYTESAHYVCYLTVDGSNNITYGTSYYMPGGGGSIRDNAAGKQMVLQTANVAVIAMESKVTVVELGPSTATNHLTTSGFDSFWWPQCYAWTSSFIMQLGSADASPQAIYIRMFERANFNITLAGTTTLIGGIKGTTMNGISLESLNPALNLFLVCYAPSNIDYARICLFSFEPIETTVFDEKEFALNEVSQVSITVLSTSKALLFFVTGEKLLYRVVTVEQVLDKHEIRLGPTKACTHVEYNEARLINNNSMKINSTRALCCYQDCGIETGYDSLGSIFTLE